MKSAPPIRIEEDLEATDLYSDERYSTRSAPVDRARGQNFALNIATLGRR
jgi:hypothetical protein